MTSKQEDIKKGLFDILNNCPKDKCENDDPDTCIRCDVNRVIAYLSGKGLIISGNWQSRDWLLMQTLVNPEEYRITFAKWQH